MNKKLISLLLTVIIFTLSLSGSFTGAESSLEKNVPENAERSGDKAIETIKENYFSAKEMIVSGNWEDYIGDIETFVYGLIINQLRYSYDVFPASVDLHDGHVVYGIAYTDYSKSYVNEDESKCYFETGFLPFAGETDIPYEEFDYGLELDNLEFTDEETSFIWTYGSASFC